MPLVHALCFRYVQVLATIGWWSGANPYAHGISEHDGGDPLQWLQHPVHGTVPYLRHEVYKLWILQHCSRRRMQDGSGAAVTNTHIMCYRKENHPCLIRLLRHTAMSHRTNGFSVHVLSQNPNSGSLGDRHPLLLAYPTIPTLQWLWSADPCQSACEISRLCFLRWCSVESVLVWWNFPFHGAAHHTHC